MSGICGIFRLDGAPPAGIEAMTVHLHRRGPEGAAHVRDGPCALGHTLLGTTPEALVERLPLTHADTGCTITADCRIDNRDALITALGLPPGRVIGDGELILLAYLRWGEDCPAHVTGDFAFAVWDPRRQTLFAARDRMGMKQLIHHHAPGRSFAFASEPAAVLLAEGVPRQMNEGRVADFIEGYLEAIDYTSTFFEGVYRLPPAHCLSVSARGLQLRRYWTPDTGAELKLGTDRDYADAFLEVFTRAVAQRLRAPPGRVGSMLSGGMDSGSVVAVAARLFAQDGRGPFPTFSAIGPDPATCIETRAIFEALKMDNLAPTTVNWADPGPILERLQEMVLTVDDPFDAPMTLPGAVYMAAVGAGMRVVLDGAVGDVALAAPNHVARLLLRGRLTGALAEIRGERAFHGGSLNLRGALREILRARYGTPERLRVARFLRSRLAGHPQVKRLSESFAARVKYTSRLQAFDAANRIWEANGREDRCRAIGATSVVVARERYDRIAARFGIEPRDPFCDQAVASFATRLPDAVVQRNGWPKWVLRQAMSGLLPEAVIWRRGKEHLGADFSARVWAPGHPPAAALAAQPEVFFTKVGSGMVVADGQSAVKDDRFKWTLAVLTAFYDAQGPRTGSVPSSRVESGDRHATEH